MFIYIDSRALFWLLVQTLLLVSVDSPLLRVPHPLYQTHFSNSLNDHSMLLASILFLLYFDAYVCTSD